MAVLTSEQTMDSNQTLEHLCRIICRADGVDPDRESLGCGGLISRDQPYKLWEARVRIAETIIAAGYKKVDRVSN